MTDFAAALLEEVPAARGVAKRLGVSHEMAAVAVATVESYPPGVTAEEIADLAQMHLHAVTVVLEELKKGRQNDETA